MLVVSVEQYISLFLFWGEEKQNNKEANVLTYCQRTRMRSSICCVISLGARHDGDGNDCLGSSQYIMSAGNSPTTEANAGNAWIFSNCSLNYFQTTIQALDK